VTLALAERPGLAMIGMVEAADPDAPRLLHQLGIHAAIRKPIDPAAVPLAFITARNNVRYIERLLGKVAKLEETLRAARKIERAKAALMVQRKIDEVAAYEYLRSQAMRKRVPIHSIAKAIVDYDEAITEDC
jgi:response regulator NasT